VLSAATKSFTVRFQLVKAPSGGSSRDPSGAIRGSAGHVNVFSTSRSSFSKSPTCLNALSSCSGVRTPSHALTIPSHSTACGRRYPPRWAAAANRNVSRPHCLLFLLRQPLLRSSLLDGPAGWLARLLRHWFKRHGSAAERRASARWQMGHRMNFGCRRRTDLITRVIMGRVDESTSLVARHARWRQQKVCF